MSLSPIPSTFGDMIGADSPTRSEFSGYPETTSHSHDTLRDTTDESVGLTPSPYSEVLERTARGGQPIDIVALAVGLVITESKSLEMPEWWVGVAPQAGASPDWVRIACGNSDGTARESSSLQERVSWRLYLGMTTTCQEITGLLREFGRTTIADRLAYLHGLHDDDPDEPLLEIESLRTIASFLLSEGQMRDPEIGLAPSGLVVGQWRIPPSGILAMEFHAHDWIRFAGIGSNPRPTDPRQRISGTLEKHKAINVVRDLTRQLARHS